MNLPPIEQTYRNRILASLPASEIKLVAPHLSHLILKRSQTLHDPGQMVETVYFLEEGICSIVATMEDGSTVEVGIIGRDSFVGTPAVLGTDHSPNRSFIQIPGSGFAIKTKILLEHANNSCSVLRSSLQRGVQGLLVQTAQTAACNRVHDLEERLARWLLMCQDRMQIDHLPLTHEFLAMMMGTRRSTVTVVASMLHKAGLIEYSRGNVTVLNRAGLEDVACECYPVIHREYVRLGLL